MSLTTMWLNVVNELSVKYPIIGSIQNSSMTEESKNVFINSIIEFDNEMDMWEKKGILDMLEIDIETEYPELFEDMEDEIKNMYELTGLDVDEW